MEKLSGFDFTMKYVPSENIFPDALSGLYKFDIPGTV